MQHAMSAFTRPKSFLRAKGQGSDAHRFGIRTEREAMARWRSKRLDRAVAQSRQSRVAHRRGNGADGSGVVAIVGELVAAATLYVAVRSS
jgi:hypothetical protein